MLGEGVLSAAVGGGAGFVAGGPFAGFTAATVAALISSRGLEAMQKHMFVESGYVNNALGDRLAEIGAVEHLPEILKIFRESEGQVKYSSALVLSRFPNDFLDEPRHAGGAAHRSRGPAGRRAPESRPNGRAQRRTAAPGSRPPGRPPRPRRAAPAARGLARG